MEKNVIQTVFELWVNSEEYKKNSALENECYERNKKGLKSAVGESIYNEISDNIMDLAYDAEMAGFDSGFRYGIMFMNGVLKGGERA